MRTLALIALVTGAIACAKEQPAPKTDKAEVAAAKTTAATTNAEAEAVSCDTPGMECGGQEGGGCNKWDDEAAAVAKRSVPGDAVWKTLKVSGMTCGGCERRVIAHLGKLDGVVGVEADSELGEVRVAMASDSDAAVKAAEAEIKRLGYRVE